MESIHQIFLSTGNISIQILISNFIKKFNCFQLDLKLNSEAGGDTSTFIANGEWDLVGKNYIQTLTQPDKSFENNNFYDNIL